jgi:hypothetical protein
MKRPSFQFYPADWRNNAKLRRCSEAARGAWIDVLCLMHDSDEYGVLRWPLADIARAAGVNIKLLKELAERDVLKGGDKGCEAYIHTPVHARKKGDPITLLAKTDGCCWYSSRFLTDEWRRSVSGGDTKFKSPEPSPSRGEVKGEVKENDAPEPSPEGALGAGATSTSTSSTTLSNSECKSNTVPNEENPKTHTQTQIGLIAEGLTSIGMMPFNPQLPKFTALVDAGATVDEFVSTALEKKGTDKFNFSYLLTTMTNRRQEAAKAKPLHQGALPAKADREAGRQVAALSVFTPENTQHLQGVQLKTINEVHHEQPAITA